LIVHSLEVFRSSALSDKVATQGWGSETNRSSEAFQPHKFTTYERDGNASDEAMHRRYNR
jgi:hypothetical protein